MNKYVTMPQNDSRQIDQVLREYEQDPAKGLAHGVQKDAIQNGFGARKKKSEAKACSGGWKFFFELIKINKKYALVFWDEETTGLTGDILSSSEIEERSSGGGLGAEHADQKLSRFLTRFESGGNTGAGSFGRGKLIFQAASNKQSILIDSFRNDGQYIALDRKVIGSQLKQPDRPHVGNDAINFILKETGKVLNPLIEHGTRITILDVNQEIIEAFRASFKLDDSVRVANDFYHMIEETWWEIIRMGAQIFLRYGEDERRVVLTSPLQNLLAAKNEKNGVRVFREKNIPVSVNDETYHIKELKLIVAPEIIDEDFREIWVQRKRMKIGAIDRRISKHHKIQRKLTGYLRLEPELEALFEQGEGTTHYGYDLRSSGVRQVREVLAAKIEEFQQLLGFRSENTAGRVHNELSHALKELNEMAADLGLPTEFSVGKKENVISLNITQLTLPDDSTTRIELDDEVGPIGYRLKNYSSKVVAGDLVVTCEQGRNVKEVFKTQAIMEPGESQDIYTATIRICKEDYTPASMLLIRARFKRTDVNTVYDQVTRSLWIGMDPPITDDHVVSLDVYAPKFPRKDTRRVEMGEIIENVGFKLSNKSNCDLKLNIDVKVRKAKSPQSDVMELDALLTERDYFLPAMADLDMDIGDVNISSEVFAGVWSEPADDELRKCEIFYSVRFASTYNELQKIKGDYAAPKKSTPFYCGVDPSGQSIFKKTENIDDGSDYRRAFVRGEKIQGYTFVINTGHPAYKFVESQGAEVRESYFQEQMIFHACTLAIKNEVFEGPTEPYREDFCDNDIAPSEVALKIDEIVGGVLKIFRG